MAGSLFEALTEDERQALFGRAIRRRVPRGTTLFMEGHAVDRVGVILHGRVKVCHLTDDGQEIMFTLREPGDLLGHMEAVTDGTAIATVITLEPLEGLFLSADDFRAFLQEHPRVALLLLERMTRHLIDSDRRRLELIAHDSVGRVARRLVDLADRYGEPVEGGVRITLPILQTELASWVGISRKAVNNALQALRHRGWIQTARKEIIVKDLDALRARAT
jgi:CRP/FNR family transcriptional regulator, cyclic AMP receptor protein